jgi:hypothetical protein
MRCIFTAWLLTTVHVGASWAQRCSTGPHSGHGEPGNPGSGWMHGNRTLPYTNTTSTGALVLYELMTIRPIRQARAFNDLHQYN